MPQNGKILDINSGILKLFRGYGPQYCFLELVFGSEIRFQRRLYCPLSHVNSELGILPLECCLFTRKGPGFSRDDLFLQYLLSGCIKDSEFLVLLASVPSAA